MGVVSVTPWYWFDDRTVQIDTGNLTGGYKYDMLETVGNGFYLKTWGVKPGYNSDPWTISPSQTPLS